MKEWNVSGLGSLEAGGLQGLLVVCRACWWFAVPAGDKEATGATESPRLQAAARSTRPWAAAPSRAGINAFLNQRKQGTHKPLAG